ncbi:hypothetical protein [Lentzea cavernae]|uniref:hypothetical protein n=1 Tax=Lentzea cavernae TaxID=2020703 RepID=UPI00174BDF03|nr:hypothetical protein [Lentzea cavernae]
MLERPLHPDVTHDEDFGEIFQEMRRGDIRLAPGLSLLFPGETEPAAEVLAQQWGNPWSRFVLGGCGTEFDGRTPAEWAAEVAAAVRDVHSGPLRTVLARSTYGVALDLLPHRAPRLIGAVLPVIGLRPQRHESAL